MAQFDVHRNPGPQRAVIPYMVVEIEGTKVVLNPLQIVSVAVDRLGDLVVSLKDDGDRVIAAIDLLITRAWD
jgi:toxin CcdB